MVELTSFYNVLKRNILKEKDRKTREKQEEVIAQWLYKGYLTTDEADSLLAYLDEVYGTSEA